MAEREETEKKKEGESFSIWDLPDVPQKLPPHIEFQRTRVQCNLDAPIHVIILLRPFRFFFFLKLSKVQALYVSMCISY